jgi:endoglucanase
VVGNTIVNGAGVRIVPHGVDRSGTEYACVDNFGIFDGPSDQTSVAAMASWHINIVRVPLNEDCWLSINGVNAAYAGSNYQTAIVNYVNLLNANGLIAILDLHWNYGGTTLATGQEPMADSDHSPAFWASVASTFKGNHSVIFDLYNEPYLTSWSCWRNGGTASACGAPFDVAGMNALIAAVRSAGATNVVMAGGLGYSGDLTQWLANEPTDPTGNLAASWHVYNFGGCTTTSCWDANGGAVAASVPVVAGEIGENDCAHGFIDSFMPYLDSHDIAYLGWAWNADFACTSGPGLISNYDGTPTNYGIGLQAHFATLASQAVRGRMRSR